MGNLRDGNIFQDFTLWINNVGKIGECPGFQPPEINIQTEEFRGGGMDGTVEIPMGVEKIEFDFDLHTWDTQVWESLGYGPGSLDLPLTFRGYLISASGNESAVRIDTVGLLKSVKPGKVQAGQKTEITCSFVATYFNHIVGEKSIAEIDVFGKKMIIGGVDKSEGARAALGFTY